MQLVEPQQPLTAVELDLLEPAARRPVVGVDACGVCRTDLHVVDGELPHPKLPLIPGHEVVSHVLRSGAKARRIALGTRVGVPWLGWGSCVAHLTYQSAAASDHAIKRSVTQVESRVL